jgi:hypothetical protein
MYRQRTSLKRLVKRDVQRLKNAVSRQLTLITNNMLYTMGGVNQRMASLMETAQLLAKSQVPTETGALLKSIQIEYIYQGSVLKQAKLYIEGRAAKYAKFVEFGTGIVGEENPAEYVPSDWQYDTNEFGEEGWKFKSRSRKRSRTSTKVSGGFTKGSSWFRTQGQKGIGFMYTAYKLLKLMVRDGDAELDPKGRNLGRFTVRFGTENHFSPYVLLTKKPGKEKQWG